MQSHAHPSENFSTKPLMQLRQITELLNQFLTLVTVIKDPNKEKTLKKTASDLQIEITFNLDKEPAGQGRNKPTMYGPAATKTSVIDIAAGMETKHAHLPTSTTSTPLTFANAGGLLAKADKKWIRLTDYDKQNLFRLLGKDLSASTHESYVDSYFERGLVTEFVNAYVKNKYTTLTIKSRHKGEKDYEIHPIYDLLANIYELCRFSTLPVDVQKKGEELKIEEAKDQKIIQLTKQITDQFDKIIGLAINQNKKNSLTAIKLYFLLALKQVTNCYEMGAAGLAIGEKNQEISQLQEENRELNVKLEQQNDSISRLRELNDKKIMQVATQRAQLVTTLNSLQGRQQQLANSIITIQNQKTLWWKYAIAATLFVAGIALAATGVGSLIGASFVSIAIKTVAAIILTASGGGTTAISATYIGYAAKRDNQLQQDLVSDAQRQSEPIVIEESIKDKEEEKTFSPALSNSSQTNSRLNIIIAENDQPPSPALSSPAASFHTPANPSCSPSSQSRSALQAHSLLRKQADENDYDDIASDLSIESYSSNSGNTNTPP